MSRRALTDLPLDIILYEITKYLDKVSKMMLFCYLLDTKPKRIDADKSTLRCLFSHRLSIFKYLIKYYTFDCNQLIRLAIYSGRDDVLEWIKVDKIFQIEHFLDQHHIGWAIGTGNLAVCKWIWTHLLPTHPYFKDKRCHQKNPYYRGIPFTDYCIRTAIISNQMKLFQYFLTFDLKKEDWYRLAIEKQKIKAIKILIKFRRFYDNYHINYSKRLGYTDITNLLINNEK
jgi:hypothetical protein